MSTAYEVWAESPDWADRLAHHDLTAEEYLCSPQEAVDYDDWCESERYDHRLAIAEREVGR